MSKKVKVTENRVWIAVRINSDGKLWFDHSSVNSCRDTCHDCAEEYDPETIVRIAKVKLVEVEE